MSALGSAADGFTSFRQKMEKEGLSQSAISAFEHSYKELVNGSTGNIAEDTIRPVLSINSLENDISGKIAQNVSLLNETVVLKLNGGLGTSMGLDKAKSLLNVKGSNSFLDLTAKQILSMRKDLQSPIKFMLMNSFNTSQDTLNFLTKYPSISEDSSLELMQNKVPKIDKADNTPATWSANPHLEWCPAQQHKTSTLLRKCIIF